MMSGGGDKRRGQQGCERALGNGNLVGGNREAAFDNVEDALRGAAVAAGIVEDALRHAIGLQIGRRERVFARRQRHHARQAGAIEHERVAGQARRALRRDIAEIGVKEGLNAGISRAQSIAQHLILLIEVAQQRAGDFERTRVGGAMAGGLPQGASFKLM